MKYIHFTATLGLSLLMLLLIGCVSTPYGNFTDAPTSYNQTMAWDSVNELSRNYPPAKTLFQLQQPINDGFGNILIKMLREKGFAVIEFDKNGSQFLPKDTPTADTPSFALAYAVDLINDSSHGQYTVILRVENTLYSRFYQVNANELLPVGVWARGIYGQAE